VVVLLAYAVYPDQLPMRAAAWYAKPEATFSDALAAVRRHLWASTCHQNWPAALGTATMANFPPQCLDFLIQTACYAA
jgi:hypothetical protein